MTRRGFTLLEVVVALAILAVVTTVLVTAGARCLERADETEDIRSVGVAAQRKLLELAADGPPALEEETAWTEMEATTDLRCAVWWKKRVAVVPVVPGQIGAQDPDTLRLLELSLKLSDAADAPVHRFATLYPPPAAP